jgi:hypothetical protein
MVVSLAPAGAGALCEAVRSNMQTMASSVTASLRVAKAARPAQRRSAVVVRAEGGIEKKARARLPAPPRRCCARARATRTQHAHAARVACSRSHRACAAARRSRLHRA